jgi:hypothetical protein
MWRDPLFLVVALAVLVVLVILMVGIGSFGVGGEFHRRNANRLMRWRVGAQAVAILVILAVVAIRRLRG